MRGPRFPCTTDRSCENQGIDLGAADLYSSVLDCQWLDVTDLARSNGLYATYSAEANFLRTFPEETFDNNLVQFPIYVPSDQEIQAALGLSDNVAGVSIKYCRDLVCHSADIRAKLGQYAAYCNCEPAVVCGDAVCDAAGGETCSTCPADCNPCPCIEVDQPCNRHDECCSNTCKGPQNRKVCQGPLASVAGLPAVGGAASTSAASVAVVSAVVAVVAVALVAWFRSRRKARSRVQQAHNYDADADVAETVVG